MLLNFSTTNLPVLGFFNKPYKVWPVFDIAGTAALETPNPTRAAPIPPGGWIPTADEPAGTAEVSKGDYLSLLFVFYFYQP